MNGPDYIEAIRQAAAQFEDACGSGPAEEKAVPDKPRYHLLSAAEVTEAPPLRWIVKGLIPCRGVGQVYGASMSAKTFLLLSLAAAITDGEPWYGYRVNHIPVVYVCLEGEEGFRLRIRALEKRRCKSLSPDLHFVLEHVGINVPANVAALATVIPKGALVILDTQNASAPFVDENSARDMGSIISGAKELARAVDGFVLLVAHSGKAASRGPRGSSVQIPAWDCCIEVRKKGERREWCAVKVKDGKDGAVHPFRLALIDLGADEDGDRVTSCVAVPDEDTRQEGKALSPALQYALESLEAAIAEAGSASVHVESWRNHFYRGHTGDTAEAKKKAFQRARADLVGAGKATVENDFYSLADNRDNRDTPL